MIKLPPIEKIPEAYSAIVDNRVELKENYAIVTSSDKTKSYEVRWQENTYYSNDSATYWQGYPGYPVIAVLMLQNKLSLNQNISKYFKGINWHELNQKYKRDYASALNSIMTDFSDEIKAEINNEINKVYEEIKNLGIILTKKKVG